jgi:glycolate oxidase iron-sulfur subunit
VDVKLHPRWEDDADATRAAAAIEACVHCGFCLATCPTYLDTRDERDSPRGRIYLVRELLEQGTPEAAAQFHLDRCLTCRACETTCPSGVQYGHIVDGGRQLLERELPRSRGRALLRRLLRLLVPYPRRFAPLLRIGQYLRPLLPAVLREHVPPAQAPLPVAPAGGGGRRVILLEGCVQSAGTPRTNQAARLLLARLGIDVVATPEQGCCGALDTHLGHGESGARAMRRNIDAWWPAIEAGAEAVLSTATGCGSQLADYGDALADDPDYAARARRVSELSADLADFLLGEALDAAGAGAAGDRRRIAVHVPCSQSHALRSPDSVRTLLERLGYRLCETRDDHLCCGSAGTYSLLQPAMSRRLRTRKVQALSVDAPDLIVSANVGCQLHLAGEAAVPVQHWVELAWEAVR